MRPRRTAKSLQDVLAAANLLHRFAEGKSLAEYRRDPLLRSAVERQFQIIGEALWRVSRDDAAVFARIPDADLIVSFRHVLVHGYDAIDDQIVWDALTHDLLNLETNVRSLLYELNP